MQTTHQQGIRIFVSFDLVGSSALKLRMSGGGADEQARWMRPLSEFFRDAAQRVEDRVGELFERHHLEIAPAPVEIWRAGGDEIAFVSGRLESPAQVMVLASAFSSVLTRLDEKFLQAWGLGVKGAIWAAGFPIRNSEVYINPNKWPYFWIATPNFDDVDVSTPPVEENQRLLRDYQGPEMDLGFRLCETAMPRRLIASLEVAYFLAKNATNFPALTPTFHHVGWKRLKGVYGEAPYPIIWLDHTHKRERRNSFEEETSPFCATFLRGAGEYPATKILQLEDDYLKDTSDTRIRPYIVSDDRIPDTHAKAYGRFERG